MLSIVISPNFVDLDVNTVCWLLPSIYDSSIVGLTPFDIQNNWLVLNSAKQNSTTLEIQSKQKQKHDKHIKR